MRTRLSLLIIILLTGCRTPPPMRAVSPIVCHLTQDFAPSAQAVLPRLVGNWHINGTTNMGGAKSLQVPNLWVEFRADGHCIITQGGQASSTLVYSVTDGLRVPILRVNDTTQTTNQTSLGRSTLFICENDLVLDYSMDSIGHWYGYFGHRVNP